VPSQGQGFGDCETKNETAPPMSFAGLLEN